MIKFWKKVIVLGEAQCWEWIAGKRNGYGRIRIKEKSGYVTWSAHRLSWVIFNKKEIPKGFIICHKCDNPGCVNPHHLFLGTQKDNVVDMVTKKRHHKLKKTHCPQGHEYLGENLIIKKGYRICLICRRYFDRIKRYNDRHQTKA